MTDLFKAAWHLQRQPTVRLRREAWGGIAFDCTAGDRWELDAEGFAVLDCLATAQTLQSLRQNLRGRGHHVRLPELAGFVNALQQSGFVCGVDHNAPPLRFDPWAEDLVTDVPQGLRAPLVAHWAVTYRCNLQCASCYRQSSPARQLGSDGETRLQLVRRLGQWGVLEVALGGGEPTILPDFPQFMAAIRAQGMVPNVTTNGTIRKPSVIRALAKYAGVVHLSADRSELLDAARGRGVFDRLARTARQLHDAGVRLGANLLLTPDNVQDVGRSLDALLKLGVQEVTFVRLKGEWAAAHWPGFPRREELGVLARDLRAYLRGSPPLRLYVDTALRGEWAELGLLDDPEPEVVGCGGGQRHVALTPKGDVYPCSHACWPAYRMGNLLTDDFASLWSTGIGWSARQRYRDACRGVSCPCCTRPRPGGGCSDALSSRV